MPVIVLEARDLASPLSLVRAWALIAGCLTFSLVASLDASDLPTDQQRHTFRIFCMFSWCFFFILTFLIHVVNIIQFHSLIPVSWKNLTVTVATLATLMSLSASVFFPWVVMGYTSHQGNQSQGGLVRPCPIVAAVTACLTFLAYASEAYLIRTQTQDQRGYMASVPGLLKVLQFWGGLQMIPLLVEATRGTSTAAEEDVRLQGWQLWVSASVYSLCLLMSLVTVTVVLGDCAGRCLLPFDRILAGFSLMGVLLYMVSMVICISRVLHLWKDPKQRGLNSELVVVETVVAGVTMLAYTVDLAFSVKSLRNRSHT